MTQNHIILLSVNMSAFVFRTSIDSIPASFWTLFDVATVVRGEVHHGFLGQAKPCNGLHHSTCDQTQGISNRSSYLAELINL